MRRLRDLNVPQDGNQNLFPDGQIRNETQFTAGTPVVRELYGDILTNIYAIIRNAGLSFNGLEDNENSGYQLLEALKIFVNELNDVRQSANVNGSSISLGIDLDNLPENYVLYCQANEAITAGDNYLLQGSGSDNFTFEANASISASESFILIFRGANTELIKIQSEQNLIEQTPPATGTFFINLSRNAGVDYTGSTTSIEDIQEGTGTTLGAFAKVKGNWETKPALAFATEAENSYFVADEVKYLYFEVWADGIIYWFSEN